MSETWIVAADIGSGVDVAATIDGGLHLLALAETPLSLDHRIGCIDAVDHDGHAGPAWNNDVETARAAGKGRRCHRDQNCQCYACPHRLESRFLLGRNLNEGLGARVKAAGQTAGKPNA